MPAGRPSDYTKPLGEEFCSRLAQGRSMRSVCNDDGMPDKATICRWLAKHEDFRDQYAACAEMRADLIFEETLDIADDGTNDVRTVGDKEVVDYDHIQRSKLRVDTRKWFLSKLQPKKYGEKQQVEMSGEVNYVARLPENPKTVSEWAEKHVPKI